MQAQINNTAFSRGLKQLNRDVLKLRGDHRNARAVRRVVDRVVSDAEALRNLLGSEDQPDPSPGDKGPVERVREFLNANAELPRKEAIAELERMGINSSTARTQYQRWYKARSN